MKDQEARQATLANKKAIEHFFETEREFIDKIAELEVRCSDNAGRIAAMQMLLGILLKDAYETSEKMPFSILSAFDILARKNLEMVEDAEKGQDGLHPAFAAGSQSVLEMYHRMIKD